MTDARAISALERYRVAFSRVTWILVPLVFTAVAARQYHADGSIGRDFYVAYLPAAERLLDGLSPFDTSIAAMQSARSFPYSALDALLFAPFAVISADTARWTFTLLNLVALIAALRILKVRDLRIYAVVFLWPAVVTGWQTGNVTLLLTLGIAALWRWRDVPPFAGGLVALLVTVKLVVWPLGVWLLFTRRWAAAGWGVALGLVLNVVSWAIVGFDEIDAYRTVLREVASYEELSAYSVPALALHVDLSRDLAYALGLASGAVVLVACLIAAREKRDLAALALALGAGLLATPVVWPHYYALLIPPLVVACPRLSWPWGAPFLLWLCPLREPRLGELLVALVVLAVLVGSVCRANRSDKALAV